MLIVISYRARLHKIAIGVGVRFVIRDNMSVVQISIACKNVHYINNNK